MSTLTKPGAEPTYSSGRYFKQRPYVPPTVTASLGRQTKIVVRVRISNSELTLGKSIMNSVRLYATDALRTSRGSLERVVTDI